MKRWMKLALIITMVIIITSCSMINRPPLAPSNPSPKDRATDLPTKLTLSWNCSEPDEDYPLTYDVYLGKTENNMEKISSRQSEESKEIENLEYATTYYWKVIPYDSKGKSRNILINTWTFTTKENNKPEEPYNPQPYNNATNQSTDITLSWECSDPDGDSLTYDIYFGTSSSPPLKKAGHTSKSYDPGTLSYNTTYYWKIVAKDEHGGETTGPIWRFSVEKTPKPTITFIEVPESVCGGDEFEAVVEVLNADEVVFTLENEDEDEEPLFPEVEQNGNLYYLAFDTPEISENKEYELVVEASNAGEKTLTETSIMIYKTDKIKPNIVLYFLEEVESDSTNTYMEFWVCDETALNINSLRWDVSHGAVMISQNPVGDDDLCRQGELYWEFGYVDGEHVEITLFIEDRCRNEESKTISAYIDNCNW